jgi:hypothetical protein
LQRLPPHRRRRFEKQSGVINPLGPNRPEAPPR